MSAASSTARFAEQMSPDADTPDGYVASFGDGAALVWRHPLSSLGHRVIVVMDDDGEDMSINRSVQFAAAIVAATQKAADLNEIERSRS